MPDEFCFLAHECGYAVLFGKQLANDWTFYGDAANELAKWLLKTNPEGYWDYYSSDEGEPWAVLRDSTFKKTWMTESGLLFCPKDYIDPTVQPGHVSPQGVFRIRFIDLDEPDP